MSSPNEFWLDVHRLAESYEAEGLNSEERAENIIRSLKAMPPIVQRYILEDLASLAHHLADVNALAAADAINEQPWGRAG